MAPAQSGLKVILVQLAPSLPFLTVCLPWPLDMFSEKVCLYWSPLLACAVSTVNSVLKMFASLAP